MHIFVKPVKVCTNQVYSSDCGGGGGGAGDDDGANSSTVVILSSNIGKQTAHKSTVFKNLPMILNLQLKRSAWCR